MLNWFTRGNPLAVATLQHMNSKRLPSQQLTDAMHIASKLIDGYRDLDALVAVDGAAEISMAKFMARNRRPPTLARVDGCTVPVRGIEAILAAARLVADRAAGSRTQGSWCKGTPSACRCQCAP